MKKNKTIFKLTEDERKFEAEIKRGDWKSSSKKDSERIHAEMIEAVHTGNKDARVNLRLNPEDVEKIRDKAEREGIPYQTLIGSVLHKYATDQFLDEKAVQDIIRRITTKKMAG
jgi:predicted DNA binding CopG/RHH family protein